MRSPARAIVEHLETNGVGTFASNSGWSISVGIEPKNPSEVITLYDTGGPEVETDQQDIHRPTFQVRVRHKNYETGYAKQDEIRALLLAMNDVTILDIKFINIVVTSDIAMIQRDDNNRCIFTANYISVVQPV